MIAANITVLLSARVARADVARLEPVLRVSRENALIRGSTVTVDAASLCDRLTPSSPLVRFFPDGTADPFVATVKRDCDPVRIQVEASGRIRVRHGG